MTIEKSKYAVGYACRKKPTTPEELKKIRDMVIDPYTLTGIDKLRALYEWQGLEFDESLFESIINEYDLMND